MVAGRARRSCWASAPADRLHRSRSALAVTLVPLSYAEPFAALDWLCRVFRFAEVERFDWVEDNVTARLSGPDGGTVMISGSGDDFRTWMRERAPHFEEATGRSWPLLTHAVTVIVDDVDAHFARAERHGAEVLGAPKDQPRGCTQLRRPRSGGAPVGARHRDEQFTRSGGRCGRRRSRLTSKCSFGDPAFVREVPFRRDLERN